MLEACEDRTTPTPVITVAALADAYEGGASGAFRLTRTETSGALFVNFSLGGTATNWSDYLGMTSAGFVDGSATADVTIAAVNDTTSEPTETVVLTLASGTGYTVGTPDAATIDLLDNDVAPPTSAIPTILVLSFDGTFGVTDPLFSLLRDDEPVGSLTVSYVLRARTDPDPTTAPVHTYSRTAVFTAAYDAVDVIVPPADLGSPNQPWYITLDVLPTPGVNTDPSSSGSATAWPYVAPNAYTIESVTGATAGGSPGQVVISRVDASSPQTINYSVDPSSTAVAGTDYAVLSGMLSFAQGQTQAAITVDASAFPNVIDKAVVINLANPVAGFRFPAQPLVPIRQPVPANPPPNQNPYFTNAAGQPVNSYDVVIGYGTKAKTQVLETHAADPDDMLLTYFRNPASFESRFRINANGKIVVTTDLSVHAQPFSFGIFVADGRGGFGYATVNVTFAPLVLIGGDLYGVRSPVGVGKEDNISLMFFRTAPLPPGGVRPELQVEFGINWGGVSINNANGTADVTNEAQLAKWAGTGNYKVVFAEKRAMGRVDISVNHTNPVAVAERAKSFMATVIDRPGYVSNNLHWGQLLPHISEVHEHAGASRVTARILPAVTMYAGSNNDMQATHPQFAVDGGNAKIHDNDIHQGALNDCGPLSALQAMTRNEGKLTDIGFMLLGGQVRFRFTPVGEPQPVIYDLDAVLSRGLNMAQLSWDYDDGTIETGMAKYEIWVQMFELAYDRHRRAVLQMGIGAGGEASEFLAQVAGITSTLRAPIGAINVDTLKTLVTGALAQGEPVFLSTRDNKDGTHADRIFTYGPPGGQQSKLVITFHHVFTIMAVAGDNVAIRNPHGVVYLMTFSQLATFFDYIYAGEDGF